MSGNVLLLKLHNDSEVLVTVHQIISGILFQISSWGCFGLLESIVLLIS